MNTLVSMGTGAAFLFSAVATVFPGWFHATAGHGGVPHVFVSRLVDGAFQPPEQVDAGLAGAGSQPVVAASDGGRLVVAYVSGGGIFAFRSFHLCSLMARAPCRAAPKLAPRSTVSTPSRPA